MIEYFCHMMFNKENSETNILYIYYSNLLFISYITIVSYKVNILVIL